MDCWNMPQIVLAIVLGVASVPVLMALGVLTWLMWHMLRGHGAGNDGTRERRARDIGWTPGRIYPQDIVDLLLSTAGGNECSYAARWSAGEIERLREVVKACHQALFQARRQQRCCSPKEKCLRLWCRAREEFVRVPYGASHEDVAAINDWHKMAADALSAWENRS